MKSLVVFYSFTGNTALVAETIATDLKADIRRVEDLKPFSKFRAYIVGGRLAMKGQGVEIKPMDMNLSGYDRIFLGCPIWGWACVPAINTFIEKADFAGKNVTIFVTMGGSYGKAIQKMTDRITAKGGKVVNSFAIKTGGAKKEDIIAKAHEIARQPE